MRLATMNRLLAVGCAGILVACTTTTVTKASGEVISTTQSGSTAAPAAAKTRARARVELAAGYFRSGQMAVALEEAKRATQIDPTFADAYGLLGLIYTELGDQKSAEENFQRALQLDPANPDLNNNYGWVLCQNGRETAAMAYFQRALANPLYSTPSRANLNAGMCLMRVKDYTGAESYLRRSFEQDATNVTTKSELIKLYLATGRIERAAFYYGVLAKSVDASSESLWLGLKVARAQGDVRTETQLANELRTRFPGSREAALLTRGAFDD